MEKVFNNKLRIAIALLVTILLIGILGYKFIANYSLVDAMYMTVITVTTVGFEEVEPLSSEAKIFTILLILSSVFFITYAISAISEYIISKGNFETIKYRKEMKKINQLQNHVIICGYGRNGRQASQKLKDHGSDYVVIDNNKEVIDNESNGVLFVMGNANDDEVLLKAGIERAKSIIVALPNDADNLFIVLSARQLNQNLTIISRASKETSYKKLKLAGANNVIMPDRIGGDYMASLVVIPDLVEFIDNLSIIGNDSVNIEEVAIEAFSRVEHTKTIRDLDFRKKTGCTIIGYKDSSGNYVVNPEPETILESNSKLIVLGRPEQISELNKMFDL